MTRAKPDTNTTTARPTPEPGRPGFRVPGLLRGTTLRNLWGALGLLAAGLIITVLISLYIKAVKKSDARREFDFACNEIRINIDARLEASAQILRSGAALFDVSKEVSRVEWHIFTQRLQFEKYLPGIQGLGFALLIPRDQLEQHVQAIRGEGFPDYQVRPAGERESYTAIIYLEPFADRNLRAFGYDMLSEPVRRAAMERARDENTYALSGKVILVQETDQDIQAGVLMYVPVFHHGLPIGSIEQRRSAIKGWVYSPYRMTDLMRGTLGHWDVKGKNISLQIYDGDVRSTDSLLYESQGDTDTVPASSALSTRIIPVDFAGRRWTLRFTQPGGLASLADYSSVWLVLFGGTMSTLLLFGLTLWRQQRVRFYRDKAEAGAALISSEERFRVAAENLTDIVYEWDIKEGKIDWYGDIDGITGYPPGKFPRTISAWSAMLQPEDKDHVLAALEAQVKGVAPFNVEYRIRKRNGEWRWWSARGAALRDERGEPYKMIGSITDITMEKERLTLLAGLQQQQKLASIGTLARGMAHEINNPIMGVMNYAQLIKDKVANNASLVELTDEIIAEIRRVANMTHSLLSFTQQQDTQPFVPTTGTDVAASVLPLAEKAARERGIVLSCNIPPDLPSVSCHLGQLGQAVMALLANAMEAFDKNTLADEYLNSGDKTIQLTAQQVHKAGIAWLRLTVEDNGPGISKEIQERLLDPFFTTKDRTKHSGLGLWISRSIAQEHGGELTSESEAGHGARFHMDIPVVSGSSSFGPLKKDCHEQNTDS